MHSPPSLAALARALVWGTCLTILLGLPVGCSDDVQPPSTPTADSGHRDARADLDARDLADLADQAPDLRQPADMRQPARDMSPAPWDFGPPPDMGPAPFLVEALVPSRGPLQGGNQVRLRGQGLIEGTTVYLGSRLMPVELSADTLVGVVPAGTTPGPVTLRASLPDGRTFILPEAYTYVASLRVDDVSPTRLPTTGGVQIELRGQGFVAQSAVSFSGTSALRVEVVSDDLMRVISPPRPRGPADLRLTTPSQTLVLESAVDYFEPLALAGVDPASGPTQGGQTVTLRVRGLRSQAQVRFGGMPALILAQDLAQGTLTVQTPPHPEGLVPITVLQDTEAALQEDAYLYRADDSPRLAAVRPAFGPTQGGQEVLLIGQGLDRPNTRFTFADAPAQLIEATPTWARVRTPPAAQPGPVDVAMDAGGPSLGRLTRGYEYRLGLTLVSVEPARGDAAGGQTITLRGLGLDGVERATLGGLPAQILATTSDSVTLLTPAHAAGAVAVTLERQGLTATLPEGFTYEEPLEIWGFSPTRGAVAGGTQLTVRGRGFNSPGLNVTLAERLGSGLRRLDANNLTFLSPPGERGEATLRVARAGAQAQGPYPFEYFNPAARFGGASGAPVLGALNVSVYAQGGSPIPGAFVMLSTRPDTRYQGLTDAAGQLTLSGPDVLGAQTVTATAAGYSTTTVQSVDAENVTLFLTQLDPRPGQGGGGDPPPSAIIRGRVTTLGKLADPGKPRTYDMALVRTTTPAPQGGGPNPGPGGLIIGGSGDYEIISRVGDLAVLALCGVYDEDTQAFSPQFLGVRRFLFVSDRDLLTDIDLACDIPLDQRLQIKLINPAFAPEGPTSNLVTATWSFGFEGFFPSPTDAEGLTDLLWLERQPALTGPLADVTLELVGGSFTERFSPYTQTQLRGVNALNRLATLPPLLPVPEPVSPLPGGALTHSELRWRVRGPYLPSLYQLTLRDERGIAVWTMIAPGSATSVRLPTFPDLSALPAAQRPSPYPRGQLFLTLTAIRVRNLSFDQFTYEDLRPERWEAHAVTRWALTISP